MQLPPTSSWLWKAFDTAAYVGLAAGVVSVLALLTGDVAGQVLPPDLLPPDGEMVRSVRTTAIVALRAAFLVLVVSTYGGILRGKLDRSWARAVVVATAMVACACIGDLIGLLADAGLIKDVLGDLADDSVERRLLRLAAMASRAIPLLTLLAAREAASAPTSATSSPGWKGTFLRYEPLLFTIGAATLPTILALSAIVHRELAWALPIGADTSVAACIAASMCARRRGDTQAFVGWSLVWSSMVVGLVMGLYAFGGPLPSPMVLGEYSAMSRTLLRDLHIAVLAIGILLVSARFLPRRAKATP